MRLLLAPALALLLAACSGSRPPSASAAEAPTGHCDPKLDDKGRFRDAKVEGVFVVRDAKANCVRATDAALADTGLLPHSTFKIPNALIGLETGVITGEAHAFTWDGKEHRVDAWNRDQDFASSLQASCVWCFQEVARGIGESRIAKWLHDFRYGNEDIGGGIDQFWLTGDLRMTPRQQVDFVRRSLDGELPVSQSHIELVWRVLEIERSDEGTWRGKTGLGGQEGRVIGWLVGYAERNGRRYEYATLVRGDADTSDEFDRVAAVRKPITRAFLVELGAIE